MTEVDHSTSPEAEPLREELLEAADHLTKRSEVLQAAEEE